MAQSRKPRSTVHGEHSSDRDDEAQETPTAHPEIQPIVVEITDVLDLHSFLPKEVKDVVRDYLDAAHASGFRSLRIIHGRGAGIQRKTVRTLLERDDRVVSFRDAEQGAGGWGATVVELR